MTDKPKALELADELSRTVYTRYVAVPTLGKKAATELRRLHEVNQALVEALKLCELWLPWIEVDDMTEESEHDYFETLRKVEEALDKTKEVA